MPKLLGLFLLMFLSNLSFGQKKARSLELLKKYNPDGYYIVNSYESSPSQIKLENGEINLGPVSDFAFYIQGNSEEDILSSIGTVVHESNHGFSHRMVYPWMEKEGRILEAFKKSFSLIYLKDQKSILVEHSETFPSKKLLNSIPDKLRSFRFDLYINSKNKDQSTQNQGIYGLLDEWNSYYQGTKTHYLLYDYYYHKKGGTSKALGTYMQDVDATFYAYAEFKFFILTYLHYAQSQEKAIYQAILNNESFKEAYRAIDQNFAQLIQAYFKKREGLFSHLRSQGHEVNMSGGFTYIDNSGRGNFMDSYALLMNELKKPLYQELESLLGVQK